MDSQRIREFVDKAWEERIVPSLVDYIRIPCKSPAFDPDWEANGELDRAVAHAVSFCEAEGVAGMEISVHKKAGRTPLLLLEIEGQVDDTVLLYGHLDKQPEMEGWDADKAPFEPLLKDGRLYGRGGADDGYAVYGALAAIRAIQEQGIPHARCVVVIECCEESGSYDLPPWLDELQERIGKPSLVICLDSGAGNYEQLWCTNSLRGMVAGDLEVSILNEGVHSGDASGVVPSSFRIARMLLDRIENVETGEILLPEFHVSIPEDREEEAQAAAKALGAEHFGRFPFVEGAAPEEDDNAELILLRTWMPALSVISAKGLPSLESGGNVLRPSTTLRLSIRTPPTCDPLRAEEALTEALTAEPPYGARVRFVPENRCEGWNAPRSAAWLQEALDASSREQFGKGVVHMGEGGSIPFMGLLGEKFPEAQFCVTGVLGPGSNAHGPNEFLDIAMGKKVTACMAELLVAHATRAGA